MRKSRDAEPRHADYLAERPLRYPRQERRSLYLEMRDGVRIAVDVTLPAPRRSERLPTLVRQTRYFRRFDVARALRPLLSPTTLDPMNAPLRQLAVSRGYACVDVDVRGSGASFGDRPCPWWIEGEVRDGAEIVDWVTRQPWSNGLVGSTGVSYDGTAAEFLAVTGHPAVRAVAPRFSLFDVYRDVAFPGGLHSSYFTEAWETANLALDRNDPGQMIALIFVLEAHGRLDPSWARRLDHPLSRRALGRVLGLGLGGVAPVDADREREDLARALAEHARNHYVHAGAEQVVYRDDVPTDTPIPGQGSDYFSPHTYVDRIRDAAVLGYGGWFDGGYAGAALRRHEVLSARGVASELLLGPWIHGGELDLDPAAPARQAAFDHASELLAFFDRHLLKAGEGPAEAPVRYFAMGEAGGWQRADRFPPAGTRSVGFGFRRGRRLACGPSESGAESFELDQRVRAGVRSRWRTLLCPFLVADGTGGSRSGYAAFESEPLSHDLDVAGHPVLTLAVAANEVDFALFAYLELLDGSGATRLVSEGALRSVHRTELSESEDQPARVSASFLRRDALALAPDELHVHHVELLPLACRWRAGSRLRLRLGAADTDHFSTPNPRPFVRFRVERAGSRLLLPVRDGAAFLSRASCA